MTLILKQVFNFFHLLNSDTETNPLAAGLTLGMILGFSPILSLQGFLVILLLFFLRIQVGAALLAAFAFKFLAFLLDPVTDLVGRQILEADFLRPLYQTLYNLPLVPLTRFNNSIVMGSGVFGLVLAIPAFFLFKFFIIKYRATIVARFKNSKIWKLWVGTKFYGWYASYSKLSDGLAR